MSDNDGRKKVRITFAVDGEHDPSRVIEFDPTDDHFIEGFKKLTLSFQVKSNRTRANLKKTGNSKTAEKSATLSIVKFMRSQIDWLFGEGTSQKAFGDGMTLNMISQFFSGIAPYINRARQDKADREGKG
jgi:hypothetical protein